MPGGTLTDDGETTPLKKPLEELTEKPAAKPVAKTERNKVIPAILRTIDPRRGLWSKVAKTVTLINQNVHRLAVRGNQSNNQSRVTRRPRSQGHNTLLKTIDDLFSNQIPR
jgi:hypothetical protein